MAYEQPIHLGERYGLRPQTNFLVSSGHRSTRLFEEFGLTDAIALHPYAYRRIIDQGLGIDRFMLLTRASAAALDACWEGHTLSSQYNGYCGSRNNIIWPEGEYWLNYTYELSGGSHIGAGTNGYYAGSKSSTQLTYWHEQWLAPAQNALGATNMTPALSGDQRIGGTASERFLVRNVNWGDNNNSGYHEGFVFDGFRLVGTKYGVFGSPKIGYDPTYFDPWTPVHGLGIWKAGEASRIGRVYIDHFNGAGVILVGGTPVYADTISVFNNKFAGLAFIGTALATFNFGTISGDDNPCMIDLRRGNGTYGGEAGGTINIGLIKVETGTVPTESDGWYWKGQIIGQLRGQFSVNIGAIWYAVARTKTDAAFTVDTRLAGGAEQNSNLKVGTMNGFGYQAILHDTYKHKAWLQPADFSAYGFEWNYVGSATGGTDKSFMTSFRTLSLTANNGNDRLGFLRLTSTGAVIGYFDYAGGTPYYNGYIGPTGNTGSTGPSPTPGVTAVDTWPGTYNLALGATTPIYAAVEGTGAYSSAITWSIVSGPGTLSSTSANPTTFIGPTSGGATSTIVRAVSNANGAILRNITMLIGAQNSGGGSGASGATVGLLANYTFGGTSTYYITGTTGPILMPKFRWLSASNISGGLLINQNANASYPLNLSVVRKIILRGLRLTDTNPRRQHLFANICISDSLVAELNGQLLAMSIPQFIPLTSTDVTINIPEGVPITHFLCGPGEKSAAKFELDGLELYDWI